MNSLQPATSGKPWCVARDEKSTTIEQLESSLHPTMNTDRENEEKSKERKEEKKRKSKRKNSYRWKRKWAEVSWSQTLRLIFEWKRGKSGESSDYHVKVIRKSTNHEEFWWRRRVKLNQRPIFWDPLRKKPFGVTKRPTRTRVDNERTPTESRNRVMWDDQ